MFGWWTLLGIGGWVPLAVWLAATRHYVGSALLSGLGALWFFNTLWWAAMLAEPTWGMVTPQVVQEFVQTLAVGGGSGAIVGTAVAIGRARSYRLWQPRLLLGIMAAALAGVWLYTLWPSVMLWITQGVPPVLFSVLENILRGMIQPQ
jgi:hypothetical protein